MASHVATDNDFKENKMNDRYVIYAEIGEYEDSLRIVSVVRDVG